MGILSSNEPHIYYRFGGQAVAWRNNSSLRYLLADHLSSNRGEANETGGEVGQRRYLPFGGDRAVTGASDLTRDERYTGQRRVDNGNGNANRELYHYGARWYLPGVGIFTQPDTIVPDPKNPQALNRFSYVYNNPLSYVDPSGHDPSQWDPNWVAAYQAEHGGSDPSEQDWLDYQFSLQHQGTGPGGTWTAANWAAYGEVRKILGNGLMFRIGDQEGSALTYTLFGQAIRFFGWPSFTRDVRDGPDGTVIIVTPSAFPPGTGGITLGEVILLPQGTANRQPVVVHEYVHVLQYRALGIGFRDAYEKSGGYYNWKDNLMEQQAIKIEKIYDVNPWLPGPWEFPWVVP